MKTLKSIFKVLILAVLFFTITFSSLLADGYPPTIVFGLYGTNTTYAQKGSRPETLGGIEASGLLGWRTPSFNGGYFSLNSSISVFYYFFGIEELDDFENTSIEIAIPLENNRIKIGGGVDSSFAGTGSYSEYLRPYWEAGYYIKRGRKKVQPFFIYRGYYLNQPNFYEDSIFHEGELGMEYSPSIWRGYKISLKGGVESFFEYPVYDSKGNITGNKRNDYSVDINLEVNGLLGYFSDYSINTTISLLSSNANRYVSTPGYLDENSESKLTILVEGEIGWSPNRRINLQASPYVGYEPYFGRDALNEQGNPTGETLKIFTAGSSFRADYTLNNNFFLVIKGTGAVKRANDPRESGWSLNLSGGIEYAF